LYAVPVFPSARPLSLSVSHVRSNLKVSDKKQEKERESKEGQFMAMLSLFTYNVFRNKKIAGPI
jgi:hypothetical protein